jgi:hypothetical protein
MDYRFDSLIYHRGTLVDEIAELDGWTEVVGGADVDRDSIYI